MATKKREEPDVEPGKAQFPTTEDDERALRDYLDKMKRKGLDLSRAQAFAQLFRRGAEVEGVRS
jgi:hypothetical protein